jgi:HK97 family phage major capsid protein
MAQEAEKEARQSGISVGNYAIPDLALRAMSATGQTSDPLDQGGMMIETEKSGLLMALEDRMVLRSLGTQFLTGLVGNLEKPGIGAVTSAWEGEVDETADGSPGTSQKKMEPHRLASTVIFSKQLKHQTNYNIESVLRDLIYRSVAGKLESTAINGGGANEPDGLLSASDIAAIALGTTGANPSWAKLVELETKVAENNADVNSLAYLTNSKVRGFMKSTLKSSGVAGYLMDGDGRLNGYNVGVTNYVPSNLEKSTSGTILSAILFGNFRDLVIGQWAGMDLTFDDKTLARKAQDQMTVNTWWDILVQRAESFAKIIDADTTIS